MNRWLMSILLLALLNVVTSNVFKNCYDNWSRCTTQTSFGTGILWKSCPEYCQKCKGRATGNCVQVFNQYCSGGYQCQCAGGSVPKSTNWRDIRTCAMGL